MACDPHLKSSQSIRLPGPSDRTTICGTTGSGKTQFAVWVLSTQDITERPWVIIDYKNDELINSIQKAQVIDYERLPSRPGIYILKVLPGEDEEITNWFRRVWETEGIGIYVDEGFMVGQYNKWFNACLTQGRSKNIPMIVLTQRPVRCSPFCFSEATFIVIFDLIKRKDRQTVVDDVAGLDIDYRLPQYHCFYYDVTKKRLSSLKPVPDGDWILARIDSRLPRKKRAL